MNANKFCTECFILHTGIDAGGGKHRQKDYIGPLTIVSNIHVMKAGNYCVYQEFSVCRMYEVEYVLSRIGSCTLYSAKSLLLL